MTDISPTTPTTATTATPNPVLARINRTFFRRAVGVCVVILAGGATLGVLEKALHLTFDKPPMPLTKPLEEIKMELGVPVRYRSFKDERETEDTIETLGTNKYLVRHYADITKKQGDVGKELLLNVNYYDQGSANPHVPEICWVDNGNTESPNSRQFFMVDNVPHKDKTVSPLRMRMISFYPKQEELNSGFDFSGDPNNHLKNVAYCYQVNGNYVASPAEVMSDFWKASNKYAYETKIEVTVMGYSNQEEAKKAIGDFLRVALPDIEECLPNPALLTGDPVSPAAGSVEAPVSDKSNNPN